MPACFRAVASFWNWPANPTSGWASQRSPSCWRTITPVPELPRCCARPWNGWGAEKLLWGSDLPGTLDLHTYRQLIDTVRRAPFLSEEQRRQILHDNAISVFKGLTANVGEE